MLATGKGRVKRFLLVGPVLVSAALWGCDRSSATGAATPTPVIIRQRRPIMGTDVTVSVVLADPDRADSAMATAFAPIDAVNQRMSTYIPDSELMQMNRTAHEVPVPISRDLHRALAASDAISKLTDGAFDVTCGPIIDLWRSAGRAGRVPTAAEREAVLKRCGHAKMHVDAEAGTVRFDMAGMKVNLGAVAKGYAVDQAVKALREAGYENALVEAGGDLMAAGAAPGGRPWRVGVQDPRDPDHPTLIATIAVRDRAVVTSGNYRRFTEIGGTRYSHIVDPRTAMPVDALPSVTVIAADATTADALATAVSVLGLERGMNLIESRPETECLLVTIDADRLVLHRSSGFARYEE